MKFQLRNFLLLAAASVGLAGTSHAALITYATRSAFDAANPGLALEDFQDISTIGQVLAGTNITPGVTFALTSGTDAYLAGAGQSSNPTTAIGVNTPTSAGWKMTFSTAVNAVGLDVFQNFGGGSQSGSAINATVNVYGPASVLLGSFLTSIPSGAAGFAGVYSTDALITSITVNNTSSFDVIDNVAFGLGAGSSSVPDSGSVSLLGLVLAGLLCASRRRA